MINTTNVKHAGFAILIGFSAFSATGCDDEQPAEEPPMPYTEQLSKEALEGKGEQGADLDRDRDELRDMIEAGERRMGEGGDQPPSTRRAGPTDEQKDKARRDLLGGD